MTLTQIRNPQKNIWVDKTTVFFFFFQILISGKKTWEKVTCCAGFYECVAKEEEN